MRNHKPHRSFYTNVHKRLFVLGIILELRVNIFVGFTHRKHIDQFHLLQPLLNPACAYTTFCISISPLMEIVTNFKLLKTSATVDTHPTGNVRGKLSIWHSLRIIKLGLWILVSSLYTDTWFQNSCPKCLISHQCMSDPFPLILTNIWYY